MLRESTRAAVAAVLLALAAGFAAMGSAVAQPVLDQGPGGPILVIKSPSSPFGRFYAEVLRNEGFNEFAVADIGTVNAGVLASYDVVILAQTSLTSSQASMLASWVTAGGNLIAMRPDADLASLLGIGISSGTVENGYMLIDTSPSSPGRGIVDETIQYFGAADRYTLAGASEIARLYSNSATATAHPAVTYRQVGSNGGEAIAFAFDLATSLVYARQGNPAWVNQERDSMPPMRSDDLYFGDAPFDPKPDWIDFDKIDIPQADEHQRFLANLIQHVNRDRKPLPRFWYFPRGEKAVIIMTGDDHGNNGTQGRFEQFLELSPPGCSVEEWECIRGTSYMYPNTPLPDAAALLYNNLGFEVGLHLTTNCSDYTESTLNSLYVNQIGQFFNSYPSLPPLVSQRHHCIAWSDWAIAAKVQLAHGIRLDTTYYYWPPSWVLNRPGFMTGSAMPMRFADLDGSLIDVYQAASHLTDESGQQYPFTVDSLLDWALGPKGFYGAFTANMHTDVARIPQSDAILSSAIARGVPIVSAAQMLTWLDGRNSSAFSSVSGSPGSLTFSVSKHQQAVGLQGMVPYRGAAGTITSITRNGAAVPFSVSVVKNVEYAFFDAESGSYAVVYEPDVTPPSVTSTVPANAATDVERYISLSVVFDEGLDPTTVSSATVRLERAGGTTVPTDIVYEPATRTVSIRPFGLLDETTAYVIALKGGSAGIRDVSGNAMASDFAATFTTGSGPHCPCTVFGPSDVPANPADSDPSPTELGVKFTVDVDGFVTGVRFYKGAGNTGVHRGNLWTASGALLATAQFTAETPTGWQQVDFDTPVPVQAGQVYVASYHAPNGHYAQDVNYFAGNGLHGGLINLLGDAAGGGNGVYAYGETSSFPTQPSGASNYWVDVVFFYELAPDEDPPQVVVRTPEANAQDVPTSAVVRATFDEALDPSSVTASSFELRAGGTLVPANVAYDAAARTAVLTPLAALSPSTTYSVALKSGALGIKDIAGNQLTSDIAWSFATAAPDTTPPSVLQVTPANGASNVLTVPTVRATFNEALDPSSVNATTFQLRNSGGSQVAATVAYNAQTNAAELVPAVALATGATYTATVHGGSSGVKDLAGNPLSSDVSWSFTTDAFASYSIWSAGEVPGTPAESDPSAVELGVKFTVDVSGFVAGVRFYKGEGNVGPHIGNLWTAEGQLLASKAFGNETSEGWQEVLFDSPVAVSPGQVYVASYHTPSGHYAADEKYFELAGIDAGPVNLLQDGAAGGNGVFAYGEDSAFPAESYEATNYWVDVVFRTDVVDSTPPSIVEVTPADGRADVSMAASVTVRFNEPMNAVSLSDQTFELRASGGALVPASVTYHASTWTAELRPDALLSLSETYTATIKGGVQGAVDLAGNPLAADVSWTFTVGAAAQFSAFDESAVPELPAESDPFGVELGVKLTVDLDGYITGVRFYKGDGNVGTHVGNLWTSDGQLLATAVFSNETATGWQSVSFGAPVPVQAGTVYVASYYAPNGHYSVDVDYFSSAGVDAGPVNLLQDGVAGGNGVFMYGAQSSFPSIASGGANYWVDVVFQTTVVDQTPPSVVAASPADGSSDASSLSAITARFSEPVDPATVTASTFEVRDSDGTLVGAAVSYAAGTWTARLEPAQPLSSGETYTATVRGGASGVRDAAGNPLAADVVWSFTTSENDRFSIWGPAAVPSLPAESDPSSVELGVKFTVDFPGYITGVRFYKGQGNTGTHLGNLWSESGQLLASKVFVNETATGWQEVVFDVPVPVQPGSVYVASYHAPNGHYSADAWYFAAGNVEAGPLNLLQDGVSGGNGVFAYGSQSSFPSDSYQATNYWVDVVFETTVVDDTAPWVTQVTPFDGSSDVSAATSVLVRFNEPVDEATLTNSTFELRDSQGALVPAAVSYDSAAWTARLQPSGLLSLAETYTAFLRGGALGVKDLAGNALAADVAWGFSTSPTDQYSVWDSSVTPTIVAENDTSGVELGVKFTVDLPGYITGVLFYKGPGNNGTHVGNLWSSTGQLLASKVFTNETSTGWQHVAFDSPVAVTPGVVYVASYYAPEGRYSADPWFFASGGVDAGPVNLLADSAAGGNGVFGYGTQSSFPSESFEATNYWVDVEFSNTLDDRVPPSVTSVTPTSGSVDVSAATLITASFSEPIDVATLNASTFEVRDAAWNVVPASITYNAGTRTAAFDPDELLGLSESYTATIRGGASGVRDSAGNPLASDFVWTFSTEATLGACSVPPNPIVAENCLPGNPDWEWDVNGVGDLSIQGFATDISVDQGDTISFKIDTDAAAYRIDIYRLGYYGGMGARKVATVNPSASLPQIQPDCLYEATTGLIDCGNWAVSASWQVPEDATSGIYIARPTRLDTGGASHIVFIVRDDDSTSDVLFQTSDTTWQAYNQYGGNSLYVGQPAGRAYKVSYNRPFITRIVDNGQDWLFNAEYPMVRWLEANGYDVTYFTGIDSERLGQLILNHKVFLSVGHDEYWSGPQRANVEAARDAGVHLAFFSGNEVFWKTRWEPSIASGGQPYRTLVSYKETHANGLIDPQSPPTWTGTWRDDRFSPPADGGRPENALTGTIFLVNGMTTEIKVPAEDGKMRFWRNTSIASLPPGSTATLSEGTLGYEWDEDLDNGHRPPGMIRLSTTIVENAPILLDEGSSYGWGQAKHHLTLYRHPSGALVFGAGTIQWSWGLDSHHDLGNAPPDPRMQQATVNLLADMHVQPATLQSGLVPAAASNDFEAPTSTITSPSQGAVVQRNTLVTVQGTAVDAGGGQVGGVEVSVDGGATWHPASGRSTWTYSWRPSSSGPVTIRSRAADDSANLEVPGAGINVIVN